MLVGFGEKNEGPFGKNERAFFLIVQAYEMKGVMN